jgi:3-methylcrotonyl-CoA carboxylase alpha subunit
VRHNVTLLDEGGAEFAAPVTVAPEPLILAALAAHGATAERAAAQAGAGNPWALSDGFTPNLDARISYALAWRGHTHTIDLEYRQGRAVAASVAGGAPLPLEAVELTAASVAAQIAQRRQQGRCYLAGAHLYLWTGGEQYDFALDDPRTHEFSASAATGGLTTPLPGVVVTVPVAVGQNVAAGEVLMVIEAMKMEHTITAPYAGTVQAIHFVRGDRVPEGSELLDLTRAEKN